MMEADSNISPENPIPIVDFGPAASGELDDLKRVATHVRAACEDIGFFYIANHPIPPALMSRVIEEAKLFFALPEEEKRHVLLERSANFRGYIPFNAELYPENRRGKGGVGFQLHISDEHLRSQPPDAAESFQIHRELPLDDPDVVAGKPLHGPNQWPEAKAAMRNTMLEYYDAMGTFARTVLQVFALGLDLERHFFRQYYRKPLMQLRLLHYPPHEPGDNVPYGVTPHSDAGAFSMLLQDHVGGLEICDKRGEWTFVPPLENTFVVNIGDTMKLWTNNRFQSTVHRVINTRGASRYSIPFFANPDYDAVIEPIKTCVDEDHPPVFDVLHCGESLLHTYSRIYPSAPT